MLIDNIVALTQQYGAHTARPIPIVFRQGQGCWLTDIHGKQYLDMSAALAVQVFGHCHPKLVQAMQRQCQQLTLCSRWYYDDQFGSLLQQLCALTKLDLAIPANSGAEAFDTAVKAARLWGYQDKQVPAGQAEIIVCHHNFHGRTLGAVSGSSNQKHRQDFGPFMPGFVFVPFNDVEALEAAITPNTVAFIVEPIQGEGGIQIPDADYLPQVSALCQQHDLLLICDEIQTGMGRTGTFLHVEQAGVLPDIVMLGKGLGGGMMPVSMVVGKERVMQHFTPGSHGNTFAGSALASAIARAALALLLEEGLMQRAKEMGCLLLEGLHSLVHPAIVDVRGRGLLTAVEFDTTKLDVTQLCAALADQGLLVINTGSTIRITPPLIITKAEIETGLEILQAVLDAQAC